MAYADQQLSGNRATAFVVVALLHVVVGYLLISGLAYEGFKQVVKRVTTIDVKKEEKKEEPPPPPPKKIAPPPIVAPPPKVNLAPPPPVATVVTPPPAPPPPVIIPPAPAAPPPPRFAPKGPSPKGNPEGWLTTEDYPSSAQRERREGTTRVRLSVGPDGKVTGCEVTSSSGSPDLDATACRKLQSRARFNPGTDGEGQPTSGSYAKAIRWVLPKDD